MLKELMWTSCPAFVDDFPHRGCAVEGVRSAAVGNSPAVQLEVHRSGARHLEATDVRTWALRRRATRSGARRCSDERGCCSDAPLGPICAIPPSMRPQGAAWLAGCPRAAGPWPARDDAGVGPLLPLGLPARVSRDDLLGGLPCMRGSSVWRWACYEAARPRLDHKSRPS